MSNTPLTKTQSISLAPLEKELQAAVSEADMVGAQQAVSQIARLFQGDQAHYRLLRAQLWYFEALLDTGKFDEAQKGIKRVARLARPSTRLALEASALLSVVFLREKKIADAKRTIRTLFISLNSISSDSKRRQFQQRLIARIEEECVLSEIIGTSDGAMDRARIEEDAIRLLKAKSEDEILLLLGGMLPTASAQLLTDVRTYSINQLPPPDRLLLPAPAKAAETKNIGKVTFAVLRRIAWKTFCKPTSPIFQLWSKKVPKVFDEGYFTAAIMTTFADFRIGLPLLASGICALVMKYSAEEFCELAKPKGLMIPPREK